MQPVKARSEEDNPASGDKIRRKRSSQWR